MSSSVSTSFRESIAQLYLGDQEEYQKQVASIVDRTAEQFRRALEYGDDLQELFYSTLDTLASDRQWMALTNHQDDCYEFGAHRIRGLKTPLKGCYLKYYDRLHSLLQRHILQLQDRLTLSGKSLGRNSSMEFEILSAERLKSLQKDSNSYRSQMINDTIKSYFSHLDTNNVDWSLMTMNMEIDGKMHELSQYLAPLDCQNIVIIHQNPSSLNLMLQDISKIFQKALQWDGTDMKALKENVALLEYEFAHATPCQRGSCAISEWIEMAIYRFHGYQLIYHPDRMVNLEALTLPLDEFVQEYDSMIQLKRLN